MEVDPGRPDEDGELVARFLRGDEPAFDELVRRHRMGIYRVAHRLLGNHAEADDVSQETFLRAYRALRGFRGDAAFRTWITRIAINLALNVRHARTPTVPLVDTAASGDTAGPEATLKSEIRRAVGRLPPRQRQV